MFLGRGVRENVQRCPRKCFCQLSSSEVVGFVGTGAPLKSGGHEIHVEVIPRQPVKRAVICLRKVIYSFFFILPAAAPIGRRGHSLRALACTTAS